MERDKAAHEIRVEIIDIDDEIRQARDFKEYGATHDYEYRRADALIDSLQMRKRKLKEILGDL